MPESKIKKFPSLSTQGVIGLVVGIFLILYISLHFISYFTADRISIYEVTAGSLTESSHYTAMAIREEQIVTSEQSGELYLFQTDNSEVGANSNVYSIDTSGEIQDLLTASKSSSNDLSKEEKNRMVTTIREFIQSYSDKDFQSVYPFKESVSSKLSSSYNARTMSANSDMIQAAVDSGTYYLYQAPQSGLIVYTIDGLEGTTLDNFTSESFDVNGRVETDLSAQTSVSAGDNVYKLITSQDWSLVLEINDDMAEKLKDTSTIKITFDKDGASAWGVSSIVTKTGRNYLVLKLDDSMERYANDRFLSISLNLSNNSGLKIPNSAITEKTFFTIPIAYFMEGKDSDEPGLAVVQKNQSTEIVYPTIFYSNENYYYIDSSEIESGSMIQIPDSGDTYEVGSETADLQGVYCVNKGYAVFRRIDILYQNEDYAIVNANSSYGVSLYDRIVLQGDSVHDNQIIAN